MPSHELETQKQPATRIMRQVEEEQEKLETEGVLTRQYDPLAQMTGRGDDARLAELHAARLNRTTDAHPARAGHSLLHLQRGYGNRYVQRVLAQAKMDDGEAEVAPEVEETIQRARGGGQALDSSVRIQMEPAFGVDFSGVRVHIDAEADMLNHALHARAFTTSQDIFFRQGEYSPESSSGQELLAHELTHVIQQENCIHQKTLLGPCEDNFEREADYWAQAIFTRGKYLGKPNILQETKTAQLQRQTEENTPEDKKVTTLCHRDFQNALPGKAAQHCFVWGHPKSVKAAPENIVQNDTVTFDMEKDKPRGRPDPEPKKNTTCTRTFEVDPDLVREKYKELCDLNDFNLASFNCCTCAYLSLTAAGADVAKSDFPPQNQGLGLPRSFGGGLKRSEAESNWWNDIDELEKIIDKNFSLEQIQKVPLEMKAKWIKDMIRGIYTTENEGIIVIKLFKGTLNEKRAELYKLVEGHEWSGDWKEGALKIDDDMVDALSRSQLNELRDLINAK